MTIDRYLLANNKHWAVGETQSFAPLAVVELRRPTEDKAAITIFDDHDEYEHHNNSALGAGHRGVLRKRIVGPMRLAEVDDMKEDVHTE